MMKENGIMIEQVIFEEVVDKDKKKKRRGRRPKTNFASSSSVYGSANGTHEATECLGTECGSNNVSMSMSSSFSQKCGSDSHAMKDPGMATVCNGGFSSLPTMHIREEAPELGSTKDQCQYPSVSKDNVFSRSCPEPIYHKDTNGSLPINMNSICRKNQQDADMRKNYFDPYWSVDTVNEAIQKGEIFVATFRVNAHNRLEAYCTIDGLSTDVLINGVAAQNRAVEGDVVAVRIDPLALWTRLKGSAGHTKNCDPSDGSKGIEVIGVNCKGKEKVGDDSEPNKCVPTSSDPSNFCHDPLTPIGKICSLIRSFPFKRPTGTVVAIIKKSPRRDTVVGFLGINQWLPYRDGLKKETKKKRSFVSSFSGEFIYLTPNDAKFPTMLVSLSNLPDCINKRLMEGDATLEMDLVAARIDDWREDSLLPHAHVMHDFGRGGEIEPQIAAILFENAICHMEFSAELLSNLPEGSWQVPLEELESRKDLRNLCTFTIDPARAADLDDALSVERVSDGILRVGVHIADVSYFILPDTPLDIEAQTRSTSIYLRQHKVPMLPPLLSENIASLVPGKDRLAFSILFDLNLVGDVVDRWIGRTIIRSCCKLSYQHAQDIIDKSMDVERHGIFQFPELYGQFGWEDVIGSVRILHEISKRVKENRFKDGAIRLENSKPFILFDEQGIPYDSMLAEQTESNYLVEEFMLLANRTAAEVISRAYPDCALLRRHPEPNGRKLKEFEAFWCKHGLELNTSSSGQFNLSLGKIKDVLQNDPVLFDILVSYASRPMQLATYFCTGALRDRENEWAHYALAMPLYTHFTSPLRRYADIVVHRTLSAAIEAEELYLQQEKMISKSSKGEEIMTKCFSNVYFDVHTVESKKFREAIAATTSKYRIPHMEIVADIAVYCNEKGLACRRAEDASEKLYLWALLKKRETFVAEARVLGLGPKFMSIYIHKFAIERRIYYDEVEELTVEWLETTSTLVLNLCTDRRTSRRASPNKSRPLEDVAWVINPCDLEPGLSNCVNNLNEVSTTQEARIDGIVQKNRGSSDEPGNEVEPAVLPLTVRILSTIHVALHPIGGGDGPLDIGARLYVCSYLK
ncbi:Dis3-like exonuclease [Thalictrum thalictroides]|uniref:DIS3-like exonuclease 2 n=1 Tax=Thalictrum thalictroides TaxID=46969 RepID=A0A7J6XDX7_THATH|nr:Dis3-like exonuclease [Thalictrum thalictroides]